MFIIGFILANRCSVKRLEVKVKKGDLGKLFNDKKCYENSSIYISTLFAEDLFQLLQERAR